MPIPPHLLDVPGAKELYDWFGYWPNFHDAEILSLHLNRQGTSSLRLHTWELTKDVDQKGHYVTKKHVIVEFSFKSISGLALNGFNHQNVIFELAIEKTPTTLRIDLGECYGLAGNIDAEEISIALTPFEPGPDFSN